MPGKQFTKRHPGSHPKSAANAKPKLFEFDFTVVGLKFRMDKDKRATLARSCPYRGILLVREQENKYDPNAVAVNFSTLPSWHTKKHIGYLPAVDAEVIAPLMDLYVATAKDDELVPDGLQFKSAVLTSVDGDANLTGTLHVVFIDYRSK
jgi:hypothetical protein